MDGLRVPTASITIRIHSPVSLHGIKDRSKHNRLQLRKSPCHSGVLLYPLWEPLYQTGFPMIQANNSTREAQTNLYTAWNQVYNPSIYSLLGQGWLFLKGITISISIQSDHAFHIPNRWTSVSLCHYNTPIDWAIVCLYLLPLSCGRCHRILE